MTHLMETALKIRGCILDGVRSIHSVARITERRHARQDSSIHGHGSQEFQPVEQPVHVG